MGRCGAGRKSTQGLVNHASQTTLQLHRTDELSHVTGESIDDLLGVVTFPIEAAVDIVLDPAPQGLEYQNHTNAHSDSNRAGYPATHRVGQSAVGEGSYPDSQGQERKRDEGRGTSIDNGPVDEEVDVEEPVAHDGKGD